MFLFGSCTGCGGVTNNSSALAAILLLFGAKKLPEFARGLGKSMGEFKKARQEFEHEIHKAVDEKDAKI